MVVGVTGLTTAHVIVRATRSASGFAQRKIEVKHALELIIMEYNSISNLVLLRNATVSMRIRIL
jgi:hypothetical protein